MKTRSNPIEDNQTDNSGLVAKYKTLRQKPAWIKTRRFFWAVGTVLWDSVLAVGEAAAESAAEREKKNARTFYGREDWMKDGFHPDTEDIHGNPL
jgi:hypothetical protein